MHRVAILSALSALFLFSGCAFPTGEATDPWFDDQPSELDMALTDGHLGGQIGGFANLDHDARSAVWGDEYYSEVRLNVTTPGRAAMGALMIEGNIHDFLNIEGRQFYSWNSYNSDNGVFVSFLGCEGREEGMWDYDLTSENVMVEVTKDRTSPATYLVAIEAPLTDLMNRPTSVSGEVSITLSPDLPGNLNPRN